MLIQIRERNELLYRSISRREPEYKKRSRRIPEKRSNSDRISKTGEFQREIPRCPKRAFLITIRTLSQQFVPQMASIAAKSADRQLFPSQNPTARS